MEISRYDRVTNLRMLKLFRVLAFYLGMICLSFLVPRVGGAETGLHTTPTPPDPTPTASPSPSFSLPEAPKTGTPIGNSTPGTTRPAASCPETEKPLTALIANNGQDYTSAEFPSLWFLIPYTPEQISLMEFTLNDGEEKKTIYRTEIQLVDQPGIIRVSIPKDPDYALQEGELYHWYLMVDCYPDESEEPDLVVDGWIRRKSIVFSPERLADNEYDETNELWYDVVDRIGRLHFSDPLHLDAGRAWYDLLQSWGCSWCMDEKLVTTKQHGVHNSPGRIIAGTKY